jgi:hypothetical protein
VSKMVNSAELLMKMAWPPLGRLHQEHRDDQRGCGVQPRQLSLRIIRLSAESTLCKTEIVLSGPERDSEWTGQTAKQLWDKLTSMNVFWRMLDREQDVTFVQDAITPAQVHSQRSSYLHIILIQSCEVATEPSMPGVCIHPSIQPGLQSYFLDSAHLNNPHVRSSCPDDSRPAPPYRATHQGGTETREGDSVSGDEDVVVEAERGSGRMLAERQLSLILEGFWGKRKVYDNYDSHSPHQSARPTTVCK